MPSIMRDKLVRDCFEADEIAKAIAKQQVDFVDGVFVLKDLMEYVRVDLSILDKEAVKQFDDVREKLIKAARENKVEIEKRTPTPEDEYERRDMEIKMLREDYERYKREYFYVLSLAYKRKWIE